MDWLSNSSGVGSSLITYTVKRFFAGTRISAGSNLLPLIVSVNSWAFATHVGPVAPSVRIAKASTAARMIAVPGFFRHLSVLCHENHRAAGGNSLFISWNYSNL